MFSRIFNLKKRANPHRKILLLINERSHENFIILEPTMIIPFFIHIKFQVST